jgi:hypothetical protein
MNADDLNNSQPERRDDEEELADPETPVDEDSVWLPSDEEAEEATEGEEADENDEVDEADEGDEITETMTPAQTAPNSAAPPRIVAETPLGGAPRPRPVVRADLTPAPVEAVPDREEKAPASEAAETPISSDEAPLSPAETPISPAETPISSFARAKPEPSTPPSPASRVTVTQAESPANRADDWADEDISPELAAVLFGERKPKSAAAPTREAAEVTPPAQAPAKAAPRPVEAEPPAAPITLTDVAAARRLPITAEGHSAAAPDVSLQGKMRCVQIDEPLSGDKGQRTTETRTYYKPNYPALDGRLVKSVRSEEILYADGSWWWRYERRYSDGGRDRREVRANTDRAYVERKDEVSKLAAQAGKRVRYQEEAAMILAEPEREEKHGFLSGLLGRDNEQEAGSAKVWRAATASESRHARKQGGEALRRRFLGIF